MIEWGVLTVDCSKDSKKLNNVEPSTKLGVHFVNELLKVISDSTKIEGENAGIKYRDKKYRIRTIKNGSEGYGLNRADSKVGKTKKDIWIAVNLIDKDNVEINVIDGEHIEGDKTTISSVGLSKAKKVNCSLSDLQSKLKEIIEEEGV